MLGAAGLLERDEELAAFESLAADSLAHGVLAVVAGPAGIGKTALLERAGDTVRRSGRLVLSARGVELEREFAFGVASQLLEPALDAAVPERRGALLRAAGPFASRLFASDPETGGPLPADASHEALRALSRLLAAVAAEWRPVLVVDDLHWADSASLRWLAYLAPRLREIPVLVLAAVRGDEIAARSELGALSAAGQLIRPAALTPVAVARILEQELAGPIDDPFAVACHRATGGNPLFLRELISELRAEHVRPDSAGARQVEAIGPAGIARVVLARLGRLSGDAVAVAGVASVLATHADPVTVAELADMPEARVRKAADVLVAAGIFENRLPLTFVHPILRAAVYADIGPARRAELHARAAAALAGRSANAQDLAAHILSCDPRGDPAAVSTLRRAAGEALGRGAPDAAVSYLRRAVREPPVPELRAQVVAELGIAESCGVDADATTAIEHLSQALAGGLEPDSRVRTARLLSGVLMGAHRGAEAARVLSAAIDELGDDPVEVAVPLVADLAVIGMSSPEAQRIGRRYFPRFAGVLASEEPAARRLGAAMAAGAAVMWGGEAAGAAGLALSALEGGRLLEDESADSLAFYLAPLVLLWAEHAEEARRAFAAAAADAEARGSSRGLATAISLRGAAWLRLGNLAQAHADANTALALCREIGLALGEPIGGHVLIEVLLGQGELDAARALAEEIELLAQESVWGAWMSYARARLALEQADYGQAARHATRCEAILGELGVERWPALGWRGVLAAALARRDGADSADTARELAASDLELARRYGARRLTGAALLASAEVERALGAEAEQLIPALEEAVAVLESSTARLEHARALVELGAAQRRAGSVSAARQALRAGLAGARKCGAAALAAQAHDELTATGLRPRKILAGGADALTPQERRIAEMAAAGMSNREIATALFLTSRTVETHLAHAYQKLDVSSRRELAGRLG